MRSVRMITAVGMLLLGMNTHAQAGDYKLVKKSGLISLYEKWITAINGEKARELKAVFYVKATPAEAVALLKDQSRALKWNPNAAQYKIASGADQNVWVNYIRYDVPWPVGDQDCCMQYTLRTSGNAMEVSFQSTDHKLFPVKDGVGRIEGAKGRWLLEQQSNGLMRITYTISTKRKSNLPKFITDPIIRDNMMESMALFTSLLEK